MLCKRLSSPKPGNSLGFQLQTFSNHCHWSHDYNNLLSEHCTKCHWSAFGLAQSGMTEAVILYVTPSDMKQIFNPLHIVESQNLKGSLYFLRSPSGWLLKGKESINHELTRTLKWKCLDLVFITSSPKENQITLKLKVVWKTGIFNFFWMQEIWCD